MHLLEHFKELTIYPKNAEELKGLILQLAVQGNLTSKWRLENPEVESAHILLERIKKEKKQLINDKKIPKEKPFPKIDERINEIPKNWLYCNLGETIQLLSGQDLTPKEYSQYPQKYPYLTGASQIQGGEIVLSRWTDTPKVISYVNDVLISCKGTIGKVVVNKVGEIHIARQIMAVRCHGWVINEFVKIFADSYVIKLKELSNGIIPGISREHLLNAKFLLPPLEEQKAIVEIVNELFKEVEALEEQTKARVQLKEDFVTSALQQLTNGDTKKEWAFLQNHFKTFFTEKIAVKKLRESILQLAVQGKLTEKWRNQRQAQGTPLESAPTLLEKIKAEKAQLIKEGKIKKEKPLPPIKEDEIPYELPEGWVWCRFAEIVINRDGERKPITKADRINGKYDYYGASGVIDSVNDFIFDKDLLLIGEDGANLINRSTPIAFFAKGKYWVNNHAHVIDSIFFEILEYLEKYINSISLEDYITGMAQPKMPQKRMNIIPIALPPLEEQKAIVEKVNALMAFCDELESEIEKNTELIEDLMKSSLREVLEQ
ncbi:MAG: restriction endonuclease subunit S [Cytophagales bacterium]|nr:restriction endonuclease subunit S [Cytophagales bacterium]